MKIISEEKNLKYIYVVMGSMIKKSKVYINASWGRLKKDRKNEE